mgnify:CR=1 FL=1
MTSGAQIILMVEDCPEDFEFTRRAFRRSRIGNPIHRCEDGDEALDYLFRRGRYADPATSPRPGVVLLDLNLPGADGREVVAAIKADEGLRSIPVIMLTSSSAPEDVARCYAAGANSYITKPVDVNGFFEAIENLTGFLLDLSIRPDTK